jgi:hypothetical protein
MNYGKRERCGKGSKVSARFLDRMNCSKKENSNLRAEKE